MQRHHIVVLDKGTMGADITWPSFAPFGTIEMFETSTPEETLKRVEKATIILTNKVVVTKEVINAANSLAYIGTLATGYNQVDGTAAAEKNIPVCNIPDYSTPAVAQHTFALILSLASHMCLHTSAVTQGEWADSTHFCFWKKPLTELQGKTLGVVGFGNTGAAVARLGNSFGMNILAYAPRPKAQPEFSPFAFTDLQALLASSDIVSLHCPLTPENTEMINKQSLTTMKKNALIINCSRGPLINEKDLADALNAGIIAGAGLDVVSVEPMPDSNPLRTAKNCIITPHIAWATIEARTRLLNLAVQNIEAFTNNKAINVVNGVSS